MNREAFSFPPPTPLCPFFKKNKETYLLCAQQLAESEIIHTGIVGDDGEILAIGRTVLQGRDQVLGDTTETESTDHEGGARGNILDSVLGRLVDLGQVLDLS